MTDSDDNMILNRLQKAQDNSSASTGEAENVEYVENKGDYIGTHQAEIVFTKFKDKDGVLKMYVGFKLIQHNVVCTEQFDLEDDPTKDWRTTNGAYHFLNNFNLDLNSDLIRLPALIKQGHFKKVVEIEYKPNRKNEKYPYFYLNKILDVPESVVEVPDAELIKDDLDFVPF